MALAEKKQTLTYAYESEAHHLASQVVKDYIWRENRRAEKCGCFSCKDEAQDLLKWFYSIGNWKSGTKIVHKDGKDFRVDDSDLDKEFA